MKHVENNPGFRHGPTVTLRGAGAQGGVSGRGRSLFCTAMAITLGFWSLTGCASGKKGQPSGLGGLFGGTPTAQSLSDRYEVTAKRTPLYFYSPAQKTGADLGLPQGMKVTMLKREALFSQVRTPQGQEGYVPTEDLKLLPPELVLPAEAVVSYHESAPFGTGGRRKLPEMEVVPLDLMLEEPELPTGGLPASTPAPEASLIPAPEATPNPALVPSETDPDFFNP